MYDQPVIIAAAGNGKRLGLGMPKCLVPVMGVPIIRYQMHILQNFTDIRIITGFCHDEVVRQVSEIRSDITFVHNADYLSTTTLQSLAMAVHNNDSFCLCMDGDMIIGETSFSHFMAACEKTRPCIAVADDITDDPVYAHVQCHAPEKSVITGFSRTQETAYEWANVASIPAHWLRNEPTAFYELLQQHLPCSAGLIERLEVDTKKDLEHAEHHMLTHRDYCQYASHVK